MDGFFWLLGVLYIAGFVLGLILWVKLYTFLGNALAIYRKMDENLENIRGEMEIMNRRGEKPLIK